MKISWFTVIAQLVNFLILVWLMKRFLYKPILNAIDEREKKIAAQLADAENKKAEAEKEQAGFKQKNEQFDQAKKGLMDKAVADTNEERKKLMGTARNEADALRSKQENSLKDMQESLNREIAQKTQQEVFAISRKALTDLASVSLEEQSANLFIKRLNELKEEDKKKFIVSFKADPNPILVQSAFALPLKQQTGIQDSVNGIVGTDAKFQFRVTPEIISGIELSANGFKLAWSISGYLNALERSITETIKEKSKPEPEKNAVPDTKTEPEKKEEPETKTEPKKKAEPDTKTEPEKKVEPETKTEPEKKPEPDTKAEPGKKVEPETKTEPKEE
jgi:F-type H+-transporting ATPase subunit b